MASFQQGRASHADTPVAQCCMKHRPLLSLALVALPAAGVQLQWQTPNAVCVALAAGFVVASITFVALRLTWWRLAAGLALGSWLASHIVHQPMRVESLHMRGRIEGLVVDESRRADTVKTLLIAGEVDLRDAPATACTALVHIYKPASATTLKGAWVIASATFHLPCTAVFEGDFSEQTWAGGRNATFIGTAHDMRVIRQAPGHEQFFHALQKKFEAHLRRWCSPYVAGLLLGIIAGNTEHLENEQRAAFAASGTAHVLAVSGAHVGIIMGIVLACVGGQPRRRWHLVVVVGVLLLFVVFTGSEPPAVRAVLMATLMFVGRMMQRTVDAMNIFSAVVILQLVVDPALIVRPSFLLSIAATGAIIVLLPAWSGCMNRITVRMTTVKRAFSSAASMNLAASTGVAIPSALLFSQFAIWSPLVNLVVVPLLSAAMLCGLVLVTLGMWSDALASAASWCAHVLINATEPVVTVAASYTPQLSHARATLIGTGFTIGTMWLLRSTTMRLLLTRISIAVILVAMAAQIPSPLPQGTFLRPAAHGVAIHARVGGMERRAFIGHHHGLPFVRSWHDYMGKSR